MTPEQRHNLSVAHIGYVMPEEQKRKIAETNRQQGAIKRLRDHIAKNGAWNKGKTGLGGYHWSGYVRVTPDATLFRSTIAYKEWRRQVLVRDDFTCQMCGARGGKLHADHILPYSSHPELRLSLENGRTLCIPCHHKTPTWGGRAARANRERQMEQAAGFQPSQLPPPAPASGTPAAPSLVNSDGSPIQA